MIRIGIAGYGNLGRGVELAAAKNPDMKIVAVFSRRDPSAVKTVDPSVPVYRLEEAEAHKDEIDILIICGGSATDLPTMTPALARHFHVIDSFDTHARIPEHFANVHAAAEESGHIAMISVGWDPGMFSVARLWGLAVLPDGADYTFWGRGVSQGHSDAIRRIPGVADARQYTVPVEEALRRVRSGEQPTLTTREKHVRECYVVAEDGADQAEIERAIFTMPNYFADYDTTVHFISMEELRRDHMGIPHGGTVIRTGRTGEGDAHTHVAEYRLTLDSNPEFTASVIAAYARAAYRMASRGITGCKTVLDVAPIDLVSISPEEARARYL
ncbi:MAG: diaminopimelate dehydrogenase [Clostridia bacterium]|nr:diaminopimelate dehydrogenase [Clostridia bacterium]